MIHFDIHAFGKDFIVILHLIVNKLSSSCTFSEIH